MDRYGEERNGCHSPSPPLWETEKWLDWREAGFLVPQNQIVLDPIRVWTLIGEGWRFVFDEAGGIVAYLPPHLEDRLVALNLTTQANARATKTHPRSYRKRMTS